MAHEPKPPRQPSTGSGLPTTRVYAVMGGIASGKSAVARSLAGERGVVIDADQLVGELYASADFRERLSQAFGSEVLAKDGSLDRPALAQRVFDDKDARRRLESMIHPAVREEIRRRLAAARSSAVPRVVLDVPLLLENESEHRLTSECDALIFIEAPAALRDARAVESRGWKRGEVARREAQQLPLATKRARAQHVLVNDGDRARLHTQVQELLRGLEPSLR